MWWASLGPGRPQTLQGSNFTARTWRSSAAVCGLEFFEASELRSGYRPIAYDRHNQHMESTMNSGNKEERSKMLADKYGAILQYGGDIALAVAMGSFASLLWVAPSTEGVSVFWKAVGIASAGGAGIWAGLANERFSFAWKQAAGASKGWIGPLVGLIAITIGFFAVMAVVRFAEHQRVGSACERAESNKNLEIVHHELCKDYFVRRAAIEGQLFKKGS